MNNYMIKNLQGNNFFDVIPSYNKKIKWYKDKNNLVTLLIEKKGILSVLFCKLLRKPSTTHIHLDKLGSFIWQNINAKNTVYAHALMLKEHFGEKAEPLYPRIVQYFRQLNSYGFISLKAYNQNNLSK